MKSGYQGKGRNWPNGKFSLQSQCPCHYIICRHCTWSLGTSLASAQLPSQAICFSEDEMTTHIWSLKWENIVNGRCIKELKKYIVDTEIKITIRNLNKFSNNSYQINVNKRDAHNSILQPPPGPGQREIRISSNVIILPPWKLFWAPFKLNQDPSSS